MCVDVEIQSETERLYEDPKVRKAFVRKVFSILMVQLAFTTGIIAIFVLNDEVKEYVYERVWLVWMAMGMWAVLVMALICCASVRRSYPLNFFCLGAFTFCMAFTLGFIASFRLPFEVLMAVGFTAILCFALTVFALQPWCDFTACSAVILVIVLMFAVFGIVVWFVPDREVYLAYSCVGAVVTSLVFILDIQLMMGGRHMYAISPDEHVFAALNVYLDIATMFLHLLNIIGLMNE